MSDEFLCFHFRVLKPIRRPDPIDLPCQAFKYPLAVFIPVTGGTGVVIDRPIAFHAQQVDIWSVGMAKCKVDEVIGHADLSVNLTAVTLDRFARIQAHPTVVQ